MYGETQQEQITYAGASLKSQQAIPATRRQQLQYRKDNIEAQLAKVNAALEALDAHPDLEKFFNTIEQASY